MTTNMIRKGLAVGSGVALASTLLVGAPANAAITQINLAPISGSSTGAILGGGFALAATSTGASEDTLTFNVAGHDTLTEVLTKSVDVDDLLDSDGDPITANDFGAGDETYNALSESTGSSPFEGEAADGESFYFTQAHDTGKPYVLAGIGLDEEEVTETTTLTVFAFVDSNNNGIHEPAVDGAKSNSVSITYYAEDEVTFSASQTVDANGDKVTVTVDPTNVNGASIFEDASELTELFNTKIFVNGTEDNDGDMSIQATHWDKDDNVFERETSGTDVPSADGDIVTTKVYPGDSTSDEQTVRTDSDASDVDAYGDIKVAATELYAKSNSDFDLREGDGQVTVSIRVYDEGDDTTDEGSDSDSWDDVPLAGETVTWEIAESASFDSKTSVTAGGLTLEDGDSAIKPTSVTDETGTATLTIAYSDLDSGDAFTVDASVLSSGVGNSGGTKTFTAATPSSYDIVITDGDTSGSIIRELGSTITVNLALRDEFGLAPAEAAQAKITVTGGATAVEEVVTFPAGTGNTSMSFDDPTASSETSNELTIVQADVRTSTELDFEDSDGDFGNSDGNDQATVTLVGQDKIQLVETLDSVNSVDFTTGSSHVDTTGVELLDEQASGAVIAPLDLRLTGGAALESAYGASSGVAAALTTTGRQATLVAKATDEDGLGIEGAEVTFSADGFLFVDENETLFGAGQITVHTKSDGTAKVYFGSNVSGDHEVTVTAGGSSDTLDVSIDYADPDNFDSIEVTSSATVASGSTYAFSANIVDENGNGLISAGGVTDDTLTVSYDGPGLTVATLPDEASSKGVISFDVLMGSNDSGTGTVTLKYENDDIDGDHEYELEFELTVGDVASTEDVEYGTQKAWTVNQDDGTAKVYVKFPEVGGKLRILHQTGGSGSYDSIYSKTTTSETMDGLRIVEGVGTYVVRTIDLADGTNRIRVSVDGEDIEVNGKDRPARYNE